ncbi:cell envelope integrity protein TolA [bacterium]|jgi:colicin import membrane protein|nr:cell envelope integrity protein TolA [bacterium]
MSSSSAPRYHDFDEAGSDGKPSEFHVALKRSAIAHGSIAVVILAASFIFPKKPVMYLPTLRVDVVELPDILKKDLGKVPNLPASQELLDAIEKSEKIKPDRPKAKKEKPVEDAAPDEMVLNPKTKAKTRAEREKRLKSALSRIKSLDKLQEDKSPLIRGNAISKGTSLSGDAKESDQVSYYDALRDRLQENWSLPVWLARQSYSAQILIFIDSKGRLRSFKFTKLSGNPQFDNAVKKTVEASQPFPAPPKDVADSVLLDGVLVGFPL